MKRLLVFSVCISLLIPIALAFPISGKGFYSIFESIFGENEECGPNLQCGSFICGECEYCEIIEIVDSDGDGFSDDEEKRAGSNPNNGNSKPGDIDGNGKLDSEEGDKEFWKRAKTCVALGGSWDDCKQQSKEHKEKEEVCLADTTCNTKLGKCKDDACREKIINNYDEETNPPDNGEGTSDNGEDSSPPSGQCARPPCITSGTSLIYQCLPKNDCNCNNCQSKNCKCTEGKCVNFNYQGTIYPPYFNLISFYSDCKINNICKFKLNVECDNGLWILTNKKNNPLEASIIQTIPPYDIQFTPQEEGIILIKVVCFDPIVELVREEIIVVE